MHKQLTGKIREAADFILDKQPVRPSFGFILGSGLGAFADELTDAVRIPYASIPHFEVPHVSGHAGELVLGTLHGVTCAILSGRVHLYEGHAPERVAFGVQILRALGAQKLVVTNAAGGLNEAFMPGDMMMMTDQINMTGRSPHMGPNDPELGPRFYDMSYAFSPEGQKAFGVAARACRLSLRQGVYVGVTGPAYETPAEVRMLQRMGGDAVGMSTVLEVLAARHVGLEVAGLSIISNRGAGLSEMPLSHAEVTEMAGRVRPDLCRLLGEMVREWQ